MALYVIIWFRVKLGNLEQRVNSEKPLQTVKIQIRRLIMSHLIRIFTVCPVNFVLISKQLTYNGNKVTVRINLLSQFTRLYPSAIQSFQHEDDNELHTVGEYEHWFWVRSLFSDSWITFPSVNRRALFLNRTELIFIELNVSDHL